MVVGMQKKSMAGLEVYCGERNERTMMDVGGG